MFLQKHLVYPHYSPRRFRSGAYHCLMDSIGIDDAYASEISKLTLVQLREEPKRLSTMRSSINDKVQALSLENYRVHIDNHNCGKTVRDEV